MRVAAVIPARYKSTRFEGKPLAVIQGKPMIEWVYLRACSFKYLDSVYVATDDKRIYEAVKTFGGNVLMTGEHATGTERCAEAARHVDAEYIINIQGDEPAIAADHVEGVVGLLTNGQAGIATLYHMGISSAEAGNANLVKVVTAMDGRCLYFSRAPIPYKRGVDGTNEAFKRHIGVYGFKKNVLLELADLPECALEQTEMLEQLRWLYNGYDIYASGVSGLSQAVDVPGDIEKLPDLRF